MANFSQFRDFHKRQVIVNKGAFHDPFEWRIAFIFAVLLTMNVIAYQNSLKHRIIIFFLFCSAINIEN